MRVFLPYLTAFEKKIKECPHKHMSDFSYYETWTATRKTEHLYCPDCGAHWLKGVYYTKQEWFDIYQKEM